MNELTIEQALNKSQPHFHPIVPFDISSDKIIALDFTSANLAINDGMLADIDLFSDYINKQLQEKSARYGIGGYAEHRTVYNRSRLFDSDKSEEPRRLHLGTDIWGKHGTPVMAPLPGVVHSFAFNDHYGDYGATIILSHKLEGINFHTLYGHLNLKSIQHLQKGRPIEAGETIAEFGLPIENGQWPPHLHFQLVMDMQEREGDYPGVCQFSDREKWLKASPDPDFILQLYQYCNSQL